MRTSEDARYAELQPRGLAPADLMCLLGPPTGRAWGPGRLAAPGFSSSIAFESSGSSGGSDGEAKGVEGTSGSARSASC